MQAVLTEQQESYREQDPVKIARTFRQSSVVYAGDSKQRMPNPDFHPPICQTESGAYVTEDGRQLDPQEVPEYILELGMPPELTPERAKKQVNMREAMLQAGVPDTDPQGQLTQALLQNKNLQAENKKLAGVVDSLTSRLDALEKSIPSYETPAKRGPGRPRKTPIIDR